MQRLLTEVEKAEIVSANGRRRAQKILKSFCASMCKTRLMKAESRGSVS
jgi:hypothetical protein